MRNILATVPKKQKESFGAELKKSDVERNKILQEIEPHDLIKYGIIPELVGRLPIIAPINSLTREDLVRILTEPKNALIKQYKKLFEMDEVELEVKTGALEAIADKALERKIGARGLRAVIESIMTDIMYEVPSDETIEKVIIDKDCVLKKSAPEVIYNPEKVRSVPSQKKTTRSKQQRGGGKIGA